MVITVNADTDTEDEILAVRIVPTARYRIGQAEANRFAYSGGPDTSAFAPIYYLYITDSAGRGEPTVSFTREFARLVEGYGLTQLEFTDDVGTVIPAVDRITHQPTLGVVLSRASSTATTVTIGLGGTATPGVDYTIEGPTLTSASTSFTLTVPPNETRVDHNMTVIRNDGWEDEEQIVFTLMDGSGYSLCDTCLTTRTDRITNIDSTGYTFTMNLVEGAGVTPGELERARSFSQPQYLGTVDEATAGEIRIRLQALDPDGDPIALVTDVPLSVSLLYRRAFSSYAMEWSRCS